MLSLLNSIFDLDQIELHRIYKKCIKICIIIIFVLTVFLIIKKDQYYENSYMKNEDKFLLIVDKNIVNIIRNKDSILVNDLESNYSINNVLDNGDICYLDINLTTNISNKEKGKYRIFLGKETFLEYIIRIMKNN